MQRPRPFKTRKVLRDRIPDAQGPAGRSKSRVAADETRLCGEPWPRATWPQEVRRSREMHTSEFSKSRQRAEAPNPTVQAFAKRRTGRDLCANRQDVGSNQGLRPAVQLDASHAALFLRNEALDLPADRRCGSADSRLRTRPSTRIPRTHFPSTSRRTGFSKDPESIRRASTTILPEAAARPIGSTSPSRPAAPYAAEAQSVLRQNLKKNDRDAGGMTLGAPGDAHKASTR